MKESSHNISGQKNASSQLNTDCSENAHVTKILFVCHGNICRSTMAQYVMQDLVEKNGLADSFVIDSAATSTEEIGNPVDPRTRRKLQQEGIRCGNHPSCEAGDSCRLREL